VAALETASATLLTTFRLSFLWSTRKFGDFAFVISLDDLQTSSSLIRLSRKAVKNQREIVNKKVEVINYIIHTFGDRKDGQN
jgi:hypothetical protein